MKFVEGIIFAVQSIHVTLGRCINAITESLSNIDIEYKLHVNNLLKQKGKVQKNYTFNKGSRL